MKRLLMIVAAMAVLGVAAVAIGEAATSAQEGDGPIGTLLGKVAEKLGVTEDELETAFQEARLEMIDEAVADGRLTEEQAERLRERAEEGGFPFRGRPHRAARHILAAAADVLEMPKEELVAELREGNSLADVAAAQGIGVGEFEGQLLAEVQAALDAKVTDGTITQGQADQMFQRFEENIDRIVNAHHDQDGSYHRRHGARPLEAPEAEEASEVTA